MSFTLYYTGARFLQSVLGISQDGTPTTSSLWETPALIVSWSSAPPSLAVAGQRKDFSVSEQKQQRTEEAKVTGIQVQTSSL